MTGKGGEQLLVPPRVAQPLCSSLPGWLGGSLAPAFGTEQDKGGSGPQQVVLRHHPTAALEVQDSQSREFRQRCPPRQPSAQPLWSHAGPQPQCWAPQAPDTAQKGKGAGFLATSLSSDLVAPQPGPEPNHLPLWDSGWPPPEAGRHVQLAGGSKHLGCHTESSRDLDVCRLCSLSVLWLLGSGSCPHAAPCCSCPVLRPFAVFPPSPHTGTKQ